MKPTVYLLCGLPGSGKTTYARRLRKEQGVLCFSIDDEYFKATGNLQQEHRDHKLEAQIWEHNKSQMLTLIKEGQSVSFDYGFWTKARRNEYRKLVEEAGGEVKLIYFDIPKDELLWRLKSRNEHAAKDTQYITPAMLEDFIKKFEVPYNEGEQVVKIGAF